MGRRFAPHDETFFAFACYVEEVLVDRSRLWPDWLIDNLVDDQPRELAAWAAYRAKTKQDERAFFTIVAELELTNAGLSADVLSTPQMAEYIDRRVEALIIARTSTDLISHLALTRTRSPIRSDEDGWRPGRRSMADVVAGVVCAFHPYNRSATAKFLNRGLPDDRNVDGATHRTVRDALETFCSRGALLNPNTMSYACCHLAFRARVLDCLFTFVRTDPLLRHLTLPRAAERLLKSGQLFTLLRVAEEEAGRIVGPIPLLAVPDDITATQIRILKRHLSARTRAQIGALAAREAPGGIAPSAAARSLETGERNHAEL
ncbi:hypothetical protein GCM10007036_16490 [Alsobacter metallidurans]|uniref:Uncharacterized protein n=1 Tax=Alsobacter metallidurans TaxID=340221 RepID=A0A917I6Z0_9HYPH|nr:hypothetical protein [Alsobacter metallidurans]GGH16091.1 hypothetical protein GCM10007036_16490 [Alsobacter metallidurans]